MCVCVRARVCVAYRVLLRNESGLLDALNYAQDHVLGIKRVVEDERRLVARDRLGRNVGVNIHRTALGIDGVDVCTIANG